KFLSDTTDAVLFVWSLLFRLDNKFLSDTTLYWMVTPLTPFRLDNKFLSDTTRAAKTIYFESVWRRGCFKKG
ncbi:MAG: hypothetical protein Q7T03_07375, partial [Deltaproteobacteria bacterium]|nr:hypothetical protein [Deltaproteobacteria bacterium]